MPLPKDELEEFIVDNVKKMFVDANVFKEYVMKRKESGIDWNRIKEQISKCTRTINEHILWKERTEKSYYEWSISDEKYKEQLKWADEAIIKAENEIVSLKMKLKKETDIDRYAKGIDIFRQFIDTHLDKIFEDRVLLRRFLHYVISRIDIYSKDLPKGTKMPWAPKKGSDGIQAKARKITVRMRLPQEILTSLFEEIKNNGVYATIIE